MKTTLQLDQTFLSNGWRIQYGVFGEEDTYRQTILFVHGTPWSSAVFIPLARALLSKGGSRIILYDLGGYGQSQGFEDNGSASASSSDGPGMFKGDTSVRTQAFILADLMQHLHLTEQEPHQRPAVIAHDIAGAIALRASLLQGCKYRSLMLLDTNTVLPWGDGFYKLVRSEANTFLQLPGPVFEAMVRAVIRSASYAPKDFNRTWENILADPWVDDDPEKAAVKQSRFVQQIAQANDADVAEMLDQNLYEQIDCPVKIVRGEQDTWIPKEKLERLAELLKGSFKESVAVPDAGHLVMIDQPERITLETYDWLAKY